MELTIEEFTERTGMIEDLDKVIEVIGSLDKKVFTDDQIDRLKQYLDDAGHFSACYESAKLLSEFVNASFHSYHIVTMCDADEGLVFENRMALVNRINYYIAKGEQNTELYAFEEF